MSPTLSDTPASADLSLHLVSALLARYCAACPPAALVDEHLTLLATRGVVEPYQQSGAGAPARAALAADLAGSTGTLRDAISRAKQERTPVTMHGVTVGASGRVGTRDVIVLPCDAMPSGQNVFVVIFEPPSLRVTGFASERATEKWIAGESERLHRHSLPLDRPGKTKDYAELRGLRILIVDDDPATLDAIVDVLRISGSNVRGAASTQAGCLVLDEFAAQVLISDIAMPDEDGYSFIRRLRARGAAQGGDIPALALTALDSEDDRRRALSAGYHMHLAKPVDIDRLRDAVVQLLKLRAIGPAN